MIPRLEPTPLAVKAPGPVRPEPRSLPPGVLEACLPGPGLERLRRGPAAVVTTGQQPALFTGPMYTIYKALTAIALARRLDRERGGGRPVVPVFWVAGDDHDFAEANHVHALDQKGDLVRIALRDRPAEAPLLPLSRELVGAGISSALEVVAGLAPASEFSPAVVSWLSGSYQPKRSLADAFAEALAQLLGPLGLVVFRPWVQSAKAAAVPTVLAALQQAAPLDEALAKAGGPNPPVPVGRRETLVFLEDGEGRDRLVLDGTGLVTRRGGRRYSLADVEALAAAEPERLSPNVLLRPVVEAALWPTAAYVAGPGELDYLPQAGPIYESLGVARQTPVARWSGLLLEPRVEKVLERYGLRPEDFAGPEGALEARIVRDALPPAAQAALDQVRAAIEQGYGRLVEQVKGIDPTLERPALTARNSALAATHDIEKKLVAHLKRANETLVQQLKRARASLYPLHAPQERVLGYPSFAVRYGPELLDGLMAEVERWVDALALEAASGRR